MCLREFHSDCIFVDGMHADFLCRLLFLHSSGLSPHHVPSVQFADERWGLAIPISAVLVFAFNLNLLGPTSALVTAYAVGCVATGFFVLSSDWGALAERIVSYSAKKEVNYDEYDWADLPENVKK